MIWLIIAMMVLFVIVAFSGLGWFALTLMANRTGSWACSIIAVVSFINFIVLGIVVMINL